MAEIVMAVDPPAFIAYISALPPAPKPLPIVMTINGNGIIIPTPAFIPKRLPAAIAAKPIPHRYTGSTETRPNIWVNAEKACDLADHMDVTPMVSMLKHLETHIYNIVHPPASRVCDPTIVDDHLTPTSNVESDSGEGHLG